MTNRMTVKDVNARVDAMDAKLDALMHALGINGEPTRETKAKAHKTEKPINSKDTFDDILKSYGIAPREWRGMELVYPQDDRIEIEIICSPDVILYDKETNRIYLLWHETPNAAARNRLKAITKQEFNGIEQRIRFLDYSWKYDSKCQAWYKENIASLHMKHIGLA